MYKVYEFDKVTHKKELKKKFELFNDAKNYGFKLASGFCIDKEKPMFQKINLTTYVYDTITDFCIVIKG